MDQRERSAHDRVVEHPRPAAAPVGQPGPQDVDEEQVDQAGDDGRSARVGAVDLIGQQSDRRGEAGAASAVGIDIRKAGDGRVEITVADDGVGAVATAATALERPFVRPSPTSGSGVGLYVCRGLAGQMQGRIRLLGDVPRGFAVAIELPEAA